MRKARPILLLSVFFAFVSLGFPKAPTRIASDYEDPSPHSTRFKRAGGIRFHYLDWGGEGEVMLFLTGLGNTAHKVRAATRAQIEKFKQEAPSAQVVELEDTDHYNFIQRRRTVARAIRDFLSGE